MKYKIDVCTNCKNISDLCEAKFLLELFSTFLLDFGGFLLDQRENIGLNHPEMQRKISVLGWDDSLWEGFWRFRKIPNLLCFHG